MAKRPLADNVTDQNFPYISIWFSRSVTDASLGEWAVSRLSIATETVHHDLRFTNPRTAKEVLAGPFVSLMDRYLPEGTSPVVLTANDCVLEMPTAIMKGLRVTGQEVRNGLQRVLVTFRFFLGSMNAMFQPGQTPSVLSEVECTLSTRTINDIILPALSLAVTEPSAAARQHPAAQDQLQARWERLSAAQAEIAFYCDLISRFVKARDRHESARIGRLQSLPQSSEADAILRVKTYDVDAI